MNQKPQSRPGGRNALHLFRHNKETQRNPDNIRNGTQNQKLKISDCFLAIGDGEPDTTTYLQERNAKRDMTTKSLEALDKSLCWRKPPKQWKTCCSNPLVKETHLRKESK